MAGESHDFGTVTRLETEAIGVPGQRRFRIIASNGDKTAFLWIEKEQLQALSLAVEQMLSQMKALWSRVRKEAKPAAPKGDSGIADVELRVGRLGLGFDEELKQFILIAHDVEAEQDDPPNFRCLATRSLLEHLTETIETLVSAGRPRCPLCGTPIGDQPHFCPGSNGHTHPTQTTE